MRIIFLLLALLGAQEFEVASVKPRDPVQPQRGILSGTRFSETPNGVSIAAEMFSILLYAYELPNAAGFKRLDISKIDRELLGRQFEIEARGTGNQRAMLRELLAKRFGLRAHWETRTVPVYALKVKTPGKLGPNLKPSKVGCTEWAREQAKLPRDNRAPRPEVCSTLPEIRFGVRVQKGAGTIAELIQLAPPFMQEPVIDQTGLTGNFAWEVAFGGREGSDTPTFFEAFEDQLGLKLEKTTGPWEVLVIDNVRMPSEN